MRCNITAATFRHIHLVIQVLLLPHLLVLDKAINDLLLILLLLFIQDFNTVFIVFLHLWLSFAARLQRIDFLNILQLLFQLIYRHATRDPPLMRGQAHRRIIDQIHLTFIIHDEIAFC